jgi:hypothetical protein
MVRNLIILPTFIMVMMELLLAEHFTAATNGDFSLELNINGNDLTQLETVIIDPEKEMVIDLHIFNVTKDVTLEEISVVVKFAGQTIRTLSESLDNFHIATGENYREQIRINIRKVLKLGDQPLVTGIYRTVIMLKYTAGEPQKGWTLAKNIKIPGNPLTTPAGAVGVVIGAGTVATILMLIKSLISPGISAGTTLSPSTLARALPRLHELAEDRLEPTVRGRVVGSIVKAIKRRIIKDKCPICETNLKHGYCYSCKKSAKEVQQEYMAKMRALAIQGGELLASGQETTLDDICARLGIDARMGTDVIATLKHAKLVKVKGIASKLMGKAVIAGIGIGLSTVLWVTVGGLVVLSSSVLLLILAASIIIPVAVAKSFQMKAKRTLIKHTK